MSERYNRDEEDRISILENVPDSEWGKPLLDLSNTAQRVNRMWKEELLRGYGEEAHRALERKFKTFPRDPGEVGPATLVTEAGISFSSTCAHHLLPFVGTAYFGYIPDDKVLGLSKIAWVLDHFSSRLQVQESLTGEVLDFVVDRVNPLGAILVLRAEHMCMSCRGPKKANVVTTTSALRGVVMDDPSVRAEFYSIIG